MWSENGVLVGETVWIDSQREYTAALSYCANEVAESAVLSSTINRF